LGALPVDLSPFISGIFRLESQNRLPKNFAYARAMFPGDPFERGSLLNGQAHGDLSGRIRDIPIPTQAKTLHCESDGIAYCAETTLRA